MDSKEEIDNCTCPDFGFYEINSKRICSRCNREKPSSYMPLNFDTMGKIKIEPTMAQQLTAALAENERLKGQVKKAMKILGECSTDEKKVILTETNEK